MRNSMVSDIPTLGICFDIDKLEKLGAVSYGYDAWKIFWRVIDIKKLAGGTLLFSGDTSAASRGEYIWCIAVQANDRKLLNKILVAFKKSDEFNRVAATPPFIYDERVVSEPLMTDGEVDAEGILVGNAAFARPALGDIRKEKQAQIAGKQVEVSVPVREKPASSRVANLPQLSTLQELEDYLRTDFSDGVATFWYYITPEELCDIVEKYEDLFQVHWREYSTGLSEDIVSVTLFNKGKSGENISFNGLFPFASPSDALNYCRSEHIEPSMWGVEGKYVLYFQGEKGNYCYDDLYDTSYNKAQIDSQMLWAKICERRAKYNLPVNPGSQLSQPSPEPQRTSRKKKGAVAPPAQPKPEPVYQQVIPIPAPPKQASEPFEKIPLASRLRSNPLIAVAIEVLAGMFGFLGIGWMIAGKIVTGIILLVVYLFLLAGTLGLLFYMTNITEGTTPLECCCCLPVLPLISGLILYLRTK